jgi:hypothetical protein
MYPDDPTCSKSQLEYRLKLWNFRQRLSENSWKYVRHKVRKREQQNKKSLVVISGIPITAEKVEREIRRYSPVPFLERLNLRKCLVL